MRRNKQRLRDIRLYALLTESYCHHGWKWTARELIEGGVDVLQLREKNLADGLVLSRARKLRALTREKGCLLIINDRPDIALLSDADGVHLGQDDLAPEEVRRLVGDEMIIGLSTHNLEQAKGAAGRDADYAAMGPAFATSTKAYEEGGGPEFVQELAAATELPTVAIGGINVERVPELANTGITALAACQALCNTEDPRGAAGQFRKRFSERGD